MRRLLPHAGRAVAALSLFLALASGSASLASETIRIRPGFQQILERTGVSRLSVGNPEIVEAQPLPRDGGILVVGKKEGETDLVLWEKSARTVWHVEVGSGKKIDRRGCPGVRGRLSRRDRRRGGRFGDPQRSRDDVAG